MCIYPADQYRVGAFDQRAASHVTTSGPPSEIQTIYLRQSNAGPRIYAAHNRGVGIGIAIHQNSRFKVVAWGKSAVDDLLYIGGTHPVIVGSDYRATGIVQLQRQILQRIGNTITHQARTNSTHDHLFLPP